MTIATKHRKIHRVLSGRIKSGFYNEKLPSVLEFSREFNVNPITIRKSLKKLEQEGIVSIRQREGCFINNNMRIAFILLHDRDMNILTSLCYTQLMNGIKSELEEKYHQTLAFYTERDLINDNFCIKLKNEVDGCILLGGIIHKYKNLFSEIAHVSVMGYDEYTADMVHISYNKNIIAPLIANYFISKGVKKVLGFYNVCYEKDKLKELFDEAAIELVQLNFDHRYAAKGDVFKFFTNKIVPYLQNSNMSQTGICLPCDEIASIAYQALYSRGICPQQDIPLLSINHNPYCLESIYPDLPSIDLRMPELGAKAVNILMEMIKNKIQAKKQLILLDPELKE